MIRYFFILVFACITGSAQAQEWPSITPRPQSVTRGNGYFILQPTTRIHCSEANKYEAEQLSRVIQQKTLWNIPVVVIQLGTRNAPIDEHSILLSEQPVEKPGTYSIKLETGSAVISGDASGLFYAVQTFDQLCTNLIIKKDHIAIPAIEINDYPRLQYRGMHLDVSRHFFPVEYVNRYIDFLAFHKFNYFHWHLTDDQGWRIEIKQYPKLTETGSRRSQTLLGRYGSDVYDGIPYGGFYTQEEIKEVVAYAAQRHISIIPEIDIPGHSLAALSSYPFLGCSKGPYEVMQTWGVAHDVLCAGNDSTYVFMQNVLTEVMSLFPAPYIHIGGDECPKDRWKQCPVCQQRMKAEQLKDEHELQSYFVRRMEQFVNSKGKSIIGW
ncbi:MAG TPA: beta-N-acetylhexosaminidase, partial [Ferruginibacter sp.]|nr:beta-N-acetylhexosaminidase [Ferruginibacter sp.]